MRRGEKGEPRNPSWYLGSQTLWLSKVGQAYCLMGTPARGR